MSAITAPLLVEFPPPPQAREKQIKFRAKPSVGAILARTAPVRTAAPPAAIMGIEDGDASIGPADPDLVEQQREVARLKAESMERMRVAKELELLLAARERLLDERECALAAGKADASVQAGAPAPAVTGYEGVTHPSLAQQVAFLREREAFIEASENTLFEKAQHLQEWETRLQQLEQNQSGRA